jgi:hypothetical protein
MTLPAPSWYYTVVAILITAGLVGYVILFASGRTGELRGANRWALPMMATAVVAQEMYQTWAITINNDSWFQGRYLFPVIAPVCLVLAIGLITLIQLLSLRSRSWALTGLTVAFAGLALFMALGVIGPAYKRAPLPKSSLWFVPNHTDISFGDMIALRGYEVESNLESSLVKVTLYWQAITNPNFNYSAFVHLTDDAGNLIAQDDGPPGEDQTFPPQAWLPEDIIRDQRLLNLPRTTNEPLVLRVGLYNWADGKRLQATEASNILDDAFLISLERK